MRGHGLCVARASKPADALLLLRAQGHGWMRSARQTMSARPARRSHRSKHWQRISTSLWADDGSLKLFQAPTHTDPSFSITGSAAQNPLRSMNMNYPQQQQQAQQRQQPSRLQNASKGGLGNGGLGGWNAGAGAAAGFGNVGGGLGGTGRPQQLSGFAQVMGGGGGGGQGAIDMR